MKTVDVLVQMIGQGVRFSVGENDTLKVDDTHKILTMKSYEYLKEKKSDVLALVRVHLKQCHCTGCGADFWHHVGSGDCVGCPACFGHDMLLVSDYPTELEAMRAYPAWKDEQDMVVYLHHPRYKQ